MLPPPWLLPWLSLAYGPIGLLYGTYPPMKYRQVNDMFLPQAFPCGLHIENEINKILSYLPQWSYFV